MSYWRLRVAKTVDFRLVEVIVRMAMLACDVAYIAIFRSIDSRIPTGRRTRGALNSQVRCQSRQKTVRNWLLSINGKTGAKHRSEEHTSELQSHLNLVCRLLLEKKKK